jgi:hypothetical protein
MIESRERKFDRRLTMIFPVRMLAFHGPHTVRQVDIPSKYVECMDQNDLLDWIYKYGQNDFQQIPNICSVSVGDVIELPNGENYMITSVGFRKLKKKDYEKYKVMDRHDLWMIARS